MLRKEKSSQSTTLLLLSWACSTTTNQTGLAELSFVMCGAVVDAKPDVCVMSESEYLLLVQEGKVFHYFF